MVLPAELRHRLGLQAGDQLLATVDDDATVRLIPRRAAALDLLGAARTDRDSSSPVDELLAKWRRETVCDEALPSESPA